MAVNIAAALKLGHRLSPGRRVRRSTCNVPRCGATREEPNADVSAGPLRRDNASTDRVKACAIRLSALVLDVTTSIVALPRRADVAIRSPKRTGEGIVICDATAVRCVYGHGIVGIIIDSLDDVNLALVWPVGPQHPAALLLDRIRLADGLLTMQAMFRKYLPACGRGQG